MFSLISTLYYKCSFQWRMLKMTFPCIEISQQHIWCSFATIRSRFRPPVLCNIFCHPVEHCQKKLSVLLFSLFPQLFENVHRLRRSWVRILGLSISLCRLNTETKHCVLVPRPNSKIKFILRIDKNALVRPMIRYSGSSILQTNAKRYS